MLFCIVTWYLQGKLIRCNRLIAFNNKSSIKTVRRPELQRTFDWSPNPFFTIPSKVDPIRHKVHCRIATLNGKCPDFRKIRPLDAIIAVIRYPLVLRRKLLYSKAVDQRVSLGHLTVDSTKLFYSVTYHLPPASWYYLSAPHMPASIGLLWPILWSLITIIALCSCPLSELESQSWTAPASRWLINESRSREWKSFTVGSPSERRRHVRKFMPLSLRFPWLGTLLMSHQNRSSFWQRSPQK